MQVKLAALFFSSLAAMAAAGSTSVVGSVDSLLVAPFNRGLPESGLDRKSFGVHEINGQ